MIRPKGFILAQNQLSDLVSKQRERGKDKTLSNHLTTMYGFVLERTTQITDVYNYLCKYCIILYRGPGAFKTAHCQKRYYNSCDALKPSNVMRIHEVFHLLLHVAASSVFLLFHHCHSIIPHRIPQVPSNKYGLEGLKKPFLLEWTVVPQKNLSRPLYPAISCGSNVVVWNHKQNHHRRIPTTPPCNTESHHLFGRPGTSTSSPGWLGDRSKPFTEKGWDTDLRCSTNLWWNQIWLRQLGWWFHSQLFLAKSSSHVPVTSQKKYVDSLNWISIGPFFHHFSLRSLYTSLPHGIMEAADSNAAQSPLHHLAPPRLWGSTHINFRNV